MSKRGLVGYSDALRAEYAGELTVTTVYPGYIRTPIHDAAAEQGVGLEGMVPAEALERRRAHRGPGRARTAGPRPGDHAPGWRSATRCCA